MTAAGFSGTTLLRLLASVLSAGLMIAAFPGNPFALLVWVCLVPWLLALRNARAVAGVRDDADAR